MQDVLTLGEVAQYLRVHQTTIYRLLKQHKIPAFKVGSDWRFNLASIDRWATSQERDVMTTIDGNSSSAVPPARRNHRPG